MTNNNEVQAVNEVNPVSPADYKDFNFGDLQLITAYITQNSIPRNMTITDVQRVLQTYNNLINTTVDNLNLLKSLAGEEPLVIPTEAGKS